MSRPDPSRSRELLRWPAVSAFVIGLGLMTGLEQAGHVYSGRLSADLLLSAARLMVAGALMGVVAEWHWRRERRQRGQSVRPLRQYVHPASALGYAAALGAGRIAAELGGLSSSGVSARLCFLLGVNALALVVGWWLTERGPGHSKLSD